MVLRGRKLGSFLQGNMVTALEQIRLRMPSKSGKDELVGLHRAPVKHGYTGEMPERVFLQQITEEFPCGAVDDQAEASFLLIMIGEDDHTLVEVGVGEARMSNQEAACEAGRGGRRFAHTGKNTRNMTIVERCP